LPKLLAKAYESFGQGLLSFGGDIVRNCPGKRLLRPDSTFLLDLRFLGLQPLALFLRTFVEARQFVNQDKPKVVSCFRLH
jgi:hypothetical protein